MSENNPWTDDRAKQDTLLGDEAATRTADRSGETVTGSESFADDRDERARGSGTDSGEQANLFTETEELENQQSLGGGTATVEQTGIVEEIEQDSETFEHETGTLDDGLEPERLETEVLPDRLPSGYELTGVDESGSGRVREADYRRESDIPGVDSEVIRVQEIQGSFAVYEETEDGGDNRPRPRGSFGDDFDGALEKAERIAGDRSRESGDDRERLEIPARAAEAGITATRLAERRADDLDSDRLKSVREDLAELRDDGGVLELSSETLSEFNEAIAEFGADASPSQRPQGFDVLENTVFGILSGDESEESDTEERGETVEIEFGRRSAANEARDTLPDEALTGRYDGRHKTVEIRADAVDERTLNRVSGMAADSKAHEEQKAGQVALDRREREELDFTETSVPEARSVKGVMLAEGVDDWMAHFDPTLTVDEHRDIAKRAARDDEGKRMDSGDSALEREARARRREADELETFARKGAKAGEQEAIETLVGELGWDREDARALAQSTDDPRVRRDVLDTVVARALANGRFLREPPERAPNSPSKYRNPGTGHFVGDKIDTSPGIGRDPADGQFVNKQRRL